MRKEMKWEASKGCQSMPAFLSHMLLYSPALPTYQKAVNSLEKCLVTAPEPPSPVPYAVTVNVLFVEHKDN